MTKIDDERIDRRQLIKRVGATGLAVALPACSGNNMGVTGTPVTGGGASGGPSTAGAAGSAPTATGSAGAAPVMTMGGGGGAAAGAPPIPMAGAGGAPPAMAGGGGMETAGGAPPQTAGMGGSDEGGAAGVGGAPEPAAGANTGGAPQGGGGSGSTNGDLTVPPWDDVPMCTASPTDGAGQGPFFIHNDEKDDDIDLFRQDISGRYDMAAEPGTDMELHLRILDSTSTDCNGTPVAGVEVYIWHTDGQGYYSGFGNPGDQQPDDPYAGVPGQNDLDNPDRFCRGAQISDANGVVSFKSIFPGWYNGRDVHIHLVVLQAGSASRGRMTYSGDDHIFTTQFYFEPDFTASVHTASEPYQRRTMLSAYQGAIQADEANNSGLRAKATFEGGTKVVAQMQILLTP